MKFWVDFEIFRTLDKSATCSIRFLFYCKRLLPQWIPKIWDFFENCNIFFREIKIEYFLAQSVFQLYFALFIMKKCILQNFKLSWLNFTLLFINKKIWLVLCLPLIKITRIYFTWCRKKIELNLMFSLKFVQKKNRKSIFSSKISV